jgi:hypothetical protein
MRTLPGVADGGESIGSHENTVQSVMPAALSGWARVDLVHLAYLVQPNKPDRPNRPNEQERRVDLWRVLLKHLAREGMRKFIRSGFVSIRIEKDDSHCIAAGSPR